MVDRRRVLFSRSFRSYSKIDFPTTFRDLETRNIVVGVVARLPHTQSDSELPGYERHLVRDNRNRNLVECFGFNFPL